MYLGYLQSEVGLHEVKYSLKWIQAIIAFSGTSTCQFLWSFLLKVLSEVKTFLVAYLVSLRQSPLFLRKDRASLSLTWLDALRTCRHVAMLMFVIQTFLNTARGSSTYSFLEFS